MREIAGFFAGVIFIFSGVTALVSALASLTYLMYLVLVRASMIEALTSIGYMAISLGAISLLMITAGKVSKACFALAPAQPSAKNNAPD